MKQPCLLQFALSKSFYSPAEGEYLEVVWVYKMKGQIVCYKDEDKMQSEKYYELAIEFYLAAELFDDVSVVYELLNELNS